MKGSAIALLALALITALPARSASTFTCKFTKHVYLDLTLGMETGGGLTMINDPPSESIIKYNPEVMQKYNCGPLCQEFLVSGHECAHARGVDRELMADCLGMLLMKRAGRWPAIKQEVLRAMKTWPGSDLHPSGPFRAKQLEECEKRQDALQNGK